MKNFIGFILVLFVLAALLRVDFFFTILYLFVAVYLLLRWWSRHVLRHLQVSRSLVERAFLGDGVEVTLKLENRSRLPIPWLFISDSLPVAMATPPFFQRVLSLPGNSSRTYHYRLNARQRGYYQVGPLTMQTGDLLGARQELSSRVEPDHLIVYPKILPISQLHLPTHSPHVVLPTPMPLFKDPARIIGVRSYSRGDNPRHIHWPATAATGDLLVKQFQPAIARDSAIFLNLDREDYARHSYPEPTIELAITVAASVANHILTFEDLPVGLVTTALDPLAGETRSFNLPPRKGRGRLVQILEILARVQAARETHFLERVRRAAVHLGWGTTLIIITDQAITQALSRTVVMLKRTGFQMTLVLIYPMGGYGRQAQAPLEALGIPVLRIRREKDVEVWSPGL